jgi:hypothetical protein
MDLNIFFKLLLISPFLLLGLGAIGYGIYIRLHGLSVPQEQWQKDLIRWRILGPNTSPQALADVKRCRDYVVSMSILAGGIGTVLAGIGWTIIALLANDPSTDVSPNNGEFFMASIFFSLGLGFGIGAVFAAWRLRNAAQQRVTYADLRQRRVSDYRSNAFRWLAVAMIIWTFGVLAFFAPHVGSTLQVDLWSTVVSVPNTVWSWCIVPGAMLLVFVLIEIVLFRIVGFSRLLVTSDTTVSQHADNMLRAIVIGTVQYCELLVLGHLAALPFYMLSHLLWDTHYFQIGHLPYYGLLSISLYMPVVMIFIGLGILLARGRLGGKLSGWPWQKQQKRQIPQTAGRQ